MTRKVSLIYSCNKINLQDLHMTLTQLSQVAFENVLLVTHLIHKSKSGREPVKLPYNLECSYELCVAGFGLRFLKTIDLSS